MTEQFDAKVWRALRILAEDGPASQLKRQPLKPIAPLIEAGYAYVSERRMTKAGLEEEVTISDTGMAAHLAHSKKRA